MRKYILATALVTALFGPAGYAVSQEIELGPGGVRIEPGGRHDRYYEGRSAYDARCRDLRRACLLKKERDEEGEGNCRRYHAACGER
jgi:hypothetical protein